MDIFIKKLIIGAAGGLLVSAIIIGIFAMFTGVVFWGTMAFAAIVGVASTVASLWFWNEYVTNIKIEE